jgi:hypothetical protein
MMYFLRKRAGIVFAGRWHCVQDYVHRRGCDTFETTDTCGDGISASTVLYEFKIGDVVRKNLDVVGSSISPTVDYRLQYSPHR